MGEVSLSYFWSLLLVTVLSFNLAFAFPTITNVDYNVEFGVPFTITWSDAVKPVTIDLLEFTNDNMVVLKENIAGQFGISPFLHKTYARAVS